MLRNRKGCKTCLAGRDHETARKAWAGLSRGQAVAEFIRLDDTYSRYVEARDAAGALAHWLTPKAEGGLGGISLEDRAKRLVAEGKIDFEDYTNRDLSKLIAARQGRPPLTVVADNRLSEPATGEDA